MSGFDRSGRWMVPRRFTGLAIMGGGSIDMRNASFAEQTTRITVLALMGGIDIVVPQNAEVRARGLGFWAASAVVARPALASPGRRSSS